MMKKSESTKSLNNNYRPISYSENYIYDYKKQLVNQSKESNNLLETLIDKKSDNSNGNENSNENSISGHTTTESISSLEINISTEISPEIFNNLNVTSLNQDTNIIKVYPNVNYSINTKNTDISNNLNKNISTFSKIANYIFKRLLIFVTHMTLISLFEIVFFFGFISVYEDNALINVVSSFTGNIPKQCLTLNETQKEVFTFIFDLFINKTNIEDNSNYALQDRVIYNKTLFIKSWIYFSVILSINILLLLIKFIWKIKVNLLKILTDNLFMIIFLGLYEYLFFKTIILNYDTISTPELTENLVNKFDNCLL